jgi:hypothetical protein
VIGNIYSSIKGDTFLKIISNTGETVKAITDLKVVINVPMRSVLYECFDRKIDFGESRMNVKYKVKKAIGKTEKRMIYEKNKELLQSKIIKENRNYVVIKLQGKKVIFFKDNKLYSKEELQDAVLYKHNDRFWIYGFNENKKLFGLEQISECEDFE